MAGEGMFGAPVGISNAISDEHTLAQTALTQGQTSLIPGQLAMQPLQQMNMMAEGRLHNAQAGQAEYNLAGDQIFQKAVQQSGVKTVDDQGNPLPMSKVLGQLSQMALPFSLNRAQMFGAQAAQFAGHESSVQRSQVMLQSAQARQQKADLEMIERNMSMVTDQNSLDNLNQTFIKRFGEQPPWAGLQASGMPLEDLKKAVLEHSMSVKDQLARQDKQEKDQAAAIERQKADDIKQQYLDIAKERDKRAADKAAQDKKLGKAVGMPSTAEVDSVGYLLAKDNDPALIKDDKGKLTPDARAFAQSVAEDAKVLRTKNPGITPEQATFRAYQERKTDFVVTPPPDQDWLDRVLPGAKPKASATYKSSKVGTVEAPLPLELSPTKRVQGKYYNIGGKARMWDPAGNPSQPWSD